MCPFCVAARTDSYNRQVLYSHRQRPLLAYPAFSPSAASFRLSSILTVSGVFPPIKGPSRTDPVIRAPIGRSDSDKNLVNPGSNRICERD